MLEQSRSSPSPGLDDALSFTDASAVPDYVRAHCHSTQNVYELFSVMLHCGSANGGHYMAYIK